MNSRKLLLLFAFVLVFSFSGNANDNTSVINNSITNNQRSRVVELNTITGTQHVNIDADGSVFSNQEIYSAVGNGAVKSAMSKFSKTIADVRPTKDARFPYLSSKNVTAENVEELCLKFIDDNQNKLGFNTKNIRIVNKHFQKDKWFLSFMQVYDEIDVLTSYISFVVFPTGKIQDFNSTYFNNVTIEKSKPTVSFQAIDMAATVGLADAENYQVKKGNSPVIMPIFEGRNITYRLSYVCDITLEGMECYKAIVDAQNGELITRRNLSINFNGYMESKNLSTNPQAALRIDTLKNFTKFNYNGKDTNFNAKGMFNFPDDAIGKSFTTKLEGRFAKMFEGIPSKGQIKEYSYNGTITDKGIQMFDSNGYNELFRTIYVHLNIAHDYFKNIDRDFSGLDKQINLYCQILPENQRESINNTFNASAQLDQSIYFYSINHKKVFIGISPLVLYHEYGHSCVYAKYKQKSLFGMINGTQNEAHADITSALITDNPNIDDNVLAPNISPTYGTGRNCNNNFLFPDSIVNERHGDSQILSGAFWDYRKNINNLDTARINIHLVKNYYPDGYTFEEVFSNNFEALVKAADSVAKADDDDINYDYSTHFNEINSAFTKHGIGFDLYVRTKFEHENAADVAANSPINITAKLPIITPKPITDIWVNYRTWENGQYGQIKLTKDGDEYTGTIPALSNDGIRVSYYFTYLDPFTGKINTINDLKYLNRNTKIDTVKREFYCLSGFTSKYKNPCEDVLGWSVTNSNNSRDGWGDSLGKPLTVQPSLVNTQDRVTLMRLGYNHTPNGSKCWTTQKRDSTISGGDRVILTLRDTSTLISSILPISDCKNPVLTYYLYLYTNAYSLSGIDNGGMNVQASFDGGTTWNTIQSFRNLQKPVNWDWSRQFARIQNPDNPAETYNNVRIRFVCNSRTQYDFMAMIDDIEILDADNFNKIDNFYNTAVSNIIVSPNPTNNEATLTFERALLNPEIQITNTLGIEVFNEHYFGEFIDKRLDVSNLDNGVYFVRIKSQGKIYCTKLNVIK